MGTTTELVLTTRQKIAVLRKALELLGPKGENWTRNKWFGRRTLDKKPSIYSQECDPEKADCWCLLGALEEAAYRLGITQERRASQRFGGLTSVLSAIQRRSRPDWDGDYYFYDVDEFNDHPKTTFFDVKDVVTERVLELKTEKAEQS